VPLEFDAPGRERASVLVFVFVFVFVFGRGQRVRAAGSRGAWRGVNANP
jgi:hypothetical protein